MDRPSPHCDSFIESILADLLNNLISLAAQESEQIMSLSSEFLSRESQEAIENFRKLYFQSENIRQQQDDVNRDVDKLFDDISQAVAQGKEDGLLKDNQTNKKDQLRLKLAAIQKQLEVLIQTDNHLKEKLMPAITTMQFEDSVRQRIEHLITAWQKIITTHLSPPHTPIAEILQQIADGLSSVDETESFYHLVPKSDPPANANDQNQESVLFF